MLQPWSELKTLIPSLLITQVIHLRITGKLMLCGGNEGLDHVLPSHERLALHFRGFHAIAVEDSKADVKML